MWCNTCDDFHKEGQHTLRARQERQAKGDVLRRLNKIEERLNKLEETT